MHASSNNPVRGAVRGALARACLAAAAVLPFAALAGGPADNPSDYQAHDHYTNLRDAPLVGKVHSLNKRYIDVNVALHKEQGWVVGTPCVSGPDTGAMGFHLVNLGRLADGVLDPEYPEALIYEPLPDGSFRFVGVEFIQDAADWATRHPNGPAPSVDGNLMNYVSEPNRYGLHAFYELHVWAFEDNPKGVFADWNTHVTCEHADKPPQ